MRRMSRRLFLATGTAVATLPLIRCASPQDPIVDGASVFRHGVASGDPLATRVMLWTRITTDQAAAVDVRWLMATDAALTRVVARGEGRTGAARDFTVKVDVSGLEPATTYFYRFEAEGARSRVGRTRTLPVAGVSRIRLGVVSCSNLPFGYFNAYQCLARRPDLDAVVHLGDYLYEYANGEYGDGTTLGRLPEPNKEMTILADYRARHAQYKADPDAQDVHRQHPFIVVWDDHEFANNTWRDGAKNHNPEKGEGEWLPRRNAALQAFYEWMPIREDDQSRSPRIYRTLAFGDLADLIMLDTRLAGRDQEAAARDDLKTIELTSRSLMGPAQEFWLKGELAESKRSGTRWQVLGQQVMFAPQTRPGAPTTNTDSWDGYRPARDRVFDMVDELKIDNLALLTGDVHSSWAYDVPRRPFDDYDPTTGRGSVAVEFAGTSVTSPSNLGAGADGAAQLAAVLAARPHLKYADGRYRGYYVLDLTRDRLQADYFNLRTIEDRSADETFARGFVVEAGKMHLVEASSPAAATPNAAPPAP